MNYRENATGASINFEPTMQDRVGTTRERGRKSEPLNSLNVDTILFDYGGVVGTNRIQPYWNRLAFMLNSDPKVVSDYLSDTSPHGIAFRSGDSSVEEFWGEVQQLAGVSGNDAEALMDTWARSYVVDSRMVDLSARLRNKGYQTGILMNSDARRYRHIQDTYGIEEQFDFIISSNIHRVTKPEPAAYETAKEVAGKKDDPGSILFIDDKESNVKAAAKQGMQAITYTGYEDLVAWFVEKGILEQGELNAGTLYDAGIERQAEERRRYISVISRITPLDDQEAQDIQTTLAWLRSANAIHKPSNMDEHLGVLCVMLSPDREQTFMLNHRKAQMWLPPGGHVDEGNTFTEAVASEMQEELGITARFVNQEPFFLSRTATRGLNAGHVDVTAWFLLEGDPSQQYSLYEKEASEARWVDLEQLLTLPEESNVPRATRKLLGILGSSPVRQ